MMKKFLKLFIIILCLLFAGCHKEVKPEDELNDKKAQESIEENQTTFLPTPSSSGQLKVQGSQLVDSQGNPIQLKGLSTHGISWFPDYINNDFFSELKSQWDVNVIRLAMYTAESGGYCSGGNQKQLKELIDKGVQYAIQNDLYVIIDWHILSDGNPLTYKDEAKSFFKEMSKKYSSYNHVIYEICNEPNSYTSWQDIKTYAKEVISVIRKNDSDAIIIVGTPTWSQDVDEALESPLDEYDNIMYALHFYAGTHKENLRQKMTSVIQSGLPIFVSEYGICDASGQGQIDDDQANQWIQLLDKYKVSYVAWNISNKNETSAIFQSHCHKKAGFAFEDLSDSGKWLYHMLTNKETLSTASSEGSSSDKETAVKSSGNIIQYSLNLEDTWESNGKNYYKYGVTVYNNTQKDCHEWMIDITFNENFQMMDYWNGIYQINGKELSISSKDYNGYIQSHKTIEDIGFIVSGSEHLKIIQ